MLSNRCKEILMLIFYKKYKNSGLATVLSFIGSSLSILGIVMLVISIFNGSIDVESLIFFLGGLLVNLIAKAIGKSANKKKRRKKSKKK